MQLFSKVGKMRNWILVSAFCAFFNYQVFAQAHESHTESEEMHSTEAHAETTHSAAEAHAVEEGPIGSKISEMILGHIGDNHSWDAFGHAVMIPLPCIVYTKSQGMQFFSSSKFEHGHAAYNNFKLAEYGGKIVWADATNTETIYDFSLTKNVMTLILGSFLLCFVFIWMARRYAKNRGKAPRGLQNLLESIIVFLRDDVIKASVGPRYREFLPLLLTIFFFIFFLNLMGQIPFFPGGANVTGNIAVTMVLAIVIFVYVNINGNKHYWKHIFMPDAPIGMWPILIPIEILGVVLKPFVLMLRLFANITAGHIIILGFFSLIFIFGSMKTWVGFAVSPASVGFGIFMSFMELLVAFLQAFVFTLLSSLYIGMAIEDHGHHESEHH